MLRPNFVTREQIQNARPDSVAEVGQLAAGQVVIRFSTYTDSAGLINSHFSSLAVVRGTPYRITDSEILDRGPGLGKHIRVEQLPAFTEDSPADSDPTLLRIQDFGIKGIGKHTVGLSEGLLAVREEPYQVEENLEVGPGLYVNGSNDYNMICRGGFMAIAIDSNPHLAGELGRP